MKTTKSPFKSGNSMALIIPDAIVKFFGISTKSRWKFLPTSPERIGSTLRGLADHSTGSRDCESG